MRLGVLTIFLLLAGTFIPESSVNAGVIRSSDTRGSNYAIHQRIIVYNNLSSYQNNGNSPYNYDQVRIGRPYSQNNTSDTPYAQSLPVSGISETEPSLFANSISSRNQTYSDILKIPVALLSGENINSLNQTNDVGTFLDNFKNDPLLKTIYFSSKDLIFSYQKKTGNILQLGFEMETDGKQRFKGPEAKNSRKIEQPLTQLEKNRLKQESKSLFSQISESYKTILYIILAISGTIFLIFRYILNKYI